MENVTNRRGFIGRIVAVMCGTVAAAKAAPVEQILNAGPVYSVPLSVETWRTFMDLNRKLAINEITSHYPKPVTFHALGANDEVYMYVPRDWHDPAEFTGLTQRYKP